jgi:hypothetical protein
MNKQIYLSLIILLSVLFVVIVATLLLNVIGIILSITSHSGEDITYMLGYAVGQLIIVAAVGVCIRYCKRKINNKKRGV